ncbi:gas vesicle protein GvpF [Halorubrum vacuolatum]|uniref:Gas vesicle synthesis protein GvpL/GvpF n=1 Tax=Halorubrum vacuolatum TaxID=63740 RepID=O33401_HALVU|nr:GvpL/GvpF family gas vesicle protein [Halorubrum vacuolatum]CAA69884.1 gvpF [Halorubrum vacuolatum]SNR69919.1 Gas vesicle synthesis protein GvpL/GvpF [Halorubrum vacuolatum]
MGDNIYTYGVIRQEDIEIETTGVGGAEQIYTVDYRTISAVVSDIDTTDPERTDEDVQAHNDVLREVMEYDGGRTVVPMSFGMAFKNKRALKRVLRGARAALRKALNDVEGKVELGVKIISASEQTVSSENIKSDVTAQLSELSVNETENDLFSDRLLINKSYLVERDRRSAFDDTIDDIEAQYGDEVTVKYTGPWAPYNFLDIHIGAEQQRG